MREHYIGLRRWTAMTHLLVQACGQAGSLLICRRILAHAAQRNPLPRATQAAAVQGMLVRGEEDAQ